MKFHICTSCGQKFPVNWSVRVVNSPKYWFFSSHSIVKSNESFTQVECPFCGNKEHDTSIKFLWFFSPNGKYWLIVLFLLIAILDQYFGQILASQHPEVTQPGIGWR